MLWVRWECLSAGTDLLKFIGPPLQDSFMEYCGFDREQAAEAVRIFRQPVQYAWKV